MRASCVVFFFNVKTDKGQTRQEEAGGKVVCFKSLTVCFFMEGNNIITVIRRNKNINNHFLKY